MDQAVSHWHLTTEVQVQSLASPCRIHVTQSGSGTGSSVRFGSHLSVSFYQCSTNNHSSVTKATSSKHCMA